MDYFYEEYECPVCREYTGNREICDDCMENAEECPLCGDFEMNGEICENCIEEEDREQEKYDAEHEAMVKSTYLRSIL